MFSVQMHGMATNVALIDKQNKFRNIVGDGLRVGLLYFHSLGGKCLMLIVIINIW